MTDKFNEFILIHFLESNVFENIRHSLNHIRKIMLDRHPSFKKMAIKAQFEYCCTISLIASESSRQTMHDLRILKKKNEVTVFTYSQNCGFKEMKPIELEKP